jgi:hypothetical protein
VTPAPPPRVEAEPAVVEAAPVERREAVAAEPRSGDSPAPAEPVETKAAEPRGDGPSPSRDPRWWGAGVALLSLLGGIATVATVLDYAELFEANHSKSIFLRRREIGPLLPVVLSGLGLTFVGGASVALIPLRRWSPPAATRSTVCCLAIAVPWSLVLLGDAAAVRYLGEEWMLDQVGWTAMTTWLVMLALLAAVALSVTRAWRRASWVPPRVQAGLLVAGLLWGLSLGVDFYTLDGQSYGSLFASDSGLADTWYLLFALAPVALIAVGLRCLDRDAGGWLVVAAAATPVAVLLAELAYLTDDYENPDSAVGLWFLAIPTVALAGLAVTALVQSAGEPTDEARLGAAP